jgi:hypothetical protein
MIEAAHKRHIRQLVVAARARVPAPSEATLTLKEKRAIQLIAELFSIRLISDRSD